MTGQAAVRMKTDEGELRTGDTGVVIATYTHRSGDLLVVRFEKSTRVVPSSSVEPVETDRGRAAPAART